MDQNNTNNTPNNNGKWSEDDKKALKIGAGISAAWLIILIIIFVVPMIIFSFIFIKMFKKFEKQIDTVQSNVQSQINSNINASNSNNPLVGKYYYSFKSSESPYINIDASFEIIDEKNAKYIITYSDSGTETSTGEYKVEGNKIIYTKDQCLNVESNKYMSCKDYYKEQELEGESYTITFTIKGGDLEEDTNVVYKKQ